MALTACTSAAQTGSGVKATDSPPGAGPVVLPHGDRARVDRVVDGDTVIVGGERVRLIGIDAPESVKPDSPVECYGPEASVALTRLLPRGTPVILEYDIERRDRFDRTLAYVWLADSARLVNTVLVGQGFATVATFPPNVKHLGDLEVAEDEARAADRGLWAACP